MKINFLLSSFYILLFISLFGCNQNSPEKINNYEGLKSYVITKSNMVMLDGYLEAEIVFNRNITDTINISFNDDFSVNSEISVKNESVLIKKKCTELGLHKMKGKVLLMRNAEMVFETEVSYEYVVTSPQINIFNRDLYQVLYVNMDNPIEVSVQGIMPSDITLTCNNGKILKNNDGYFVVPNKIGECEISVLINQNNQIKKIGEKIFTVKNEK